MAIVPRRNCCASPSRRYRSRILSCGQHGDHEIRERQLIDAGGSTAAVTGRHLGGLLVRAVVYRNRVPGTRDARGHGCAHGPDAHEHDVHGLLLAWRASISAAAVNASTPQGTPAYTAVCRMVSRISSMLQPLASAPATCTLS